MAMRNLCYNFTMIRKGGLVFRKESDCCQGVYRLYYTFGGGLRLDRTAAAAAARLAASRTIMAGSSAVVRPLVFSGPSGSGKSTLVKRLMGEYKGCFAFSISHTTRQPRPGEQHGKDYYFVSRDDMKKAIENNEFIEHAEFSGNLYGTSKKSVEEVMSSGKICILDIDMQGVQNIKKTNLNPHYIFIKPPSLKTLEDRLRGRGTETEESLAKRLAACKAEMEYAEKPGSYDHVIVNDDLDKAYAQLKDIVGKDADAMMKKNRNNASK